jgi:hypothetical protein
MARHRYAAVLFLALCMLYTKYCVPVSRNANPPNGILASCGSSIPPIVNALWSFILLAPCSLQHYYGQASGLGSCGRFHLEVQARSSLNIQGCGSAYNFISLFYFVADHYLFTVARTYLSLSLHALYLRCLIQRGSNELCSSRAPGL